MSLSWGNPLHYQPSSGRDGIADDEQQLLPTRRVSNASLSPTQSSPREDPSTRFAMATSPPHLIPSTRMLTNRLVGLFLFIMVSCALGLVSVSTLLGKDQELRLHKALSTASTQMSAETQQPRIRGDSALTSNGIKAFITRQDGGDAAPTPTTDVPTPTTTTPTPTVKLPVEERWRRLGDLDEYECVAWRPSADCSPNGAVDVAKSRPCNATVEHGVAGYCELRHKRSGASQRVLDMHCDSLRPGVRFKCEDFGEMLNYGRRAPQYVHDAAFSFDQCRDEFVRDQEKAVVVGKASGALSDKIRQDPQAFFRQGIAIVVYEKLLESVYASIKSLRSMGCTLPVELWYIASETNVEHPILRTLTNEHGAYLREIKDSRASRFYTKIYAVFYSAFDQVLLLDADNFAVRDPTYLFAAAEFVDTGALFWPDFWRFKKTIFNIQPTSFVWDVFDLDAVDMFEQESGQVVVDRRRHLPAMNVMMYYAFHPQLIEQMRLVWGDKDLFRFAWMKTKSSFHMIQMPPGSAGVKLPDRNVFCGVTMVQHDTKHDVLFLHRNQEKLSHENRHIVWQDLQQFKLGDVPLDEYDVRGANGGRYYPNFKRCYGKDIYYEKAFTVQPVKNLPFAGLEQSLLDYVGEAALIANATASSTN